MAKWHIGIAFVLALGILGTGALAPAPRPPATQETEPAKKEAGQRPSPPFTVPPGYVVERVAGPPLIERPMFAAFDERGRLFVCDSSGFNLLKGKSDILLQDPPHALRLLEDTDGDGRFDKSTRFADKMTFPMGALWHDGALYTASAPSLWRLEDTDGDGVADRQSCGKRWPP